MSEGVDGFEVVGCVDYERDGVGRTMTESVTWLYNGVRGGCSLQLHPQHTTLPL